MFEASRCWQVAMKPPLPADGSVWYWQNWMKSGVTRPATAATELCEAWSRQECGGSRWLTVLLGRLQTRQMAEPWRLGLSTPSASSVAQGASNCCKD